jgi:hypothetical protein
LRLNLSLSPRKENEGNRGTKLFLSKLSTINSFGYGLRDVHDFSSYQRQEILDKNMEDLLGHWALVCKSKDWIIFIHPLLINFN